MLLDIGWGVMERGRVRSGTHEGFEGDAGFVAGAVVDDCFCRRIGELFGESLGGWRIGCRVEPEPGSE